MNNTTELVFILDRSGSMHGLEGDTIGGFNGMLEHQKAEEGRALVTTVLFSTELQRLHDRLSLDQVAPLTERDYVPGGCTALLDAVGETIGHIEDIHRYARPEDVPEHTVFVIMTDGYENASHRFTLEKVKAMIEAKKRGGWEFLFLGANIDAIRTADRLGIFADRASNFVPDSQGVKRSYRSMSRAVSDARCGKHFSDDWKQEVESDFFDRG